MRVLFYDHLQDSNAPAALLSGALADTWTGTSAVITLPAAVDVDCVGIGNTDATQVTLQISSHIADGAAPCLGDDSVVSEAAGPWEPGSEQTASGPGEFDSEVVTISEPGSIANGLYKLSQTYTLSELTLSHNGTYIGRLALGMGVVLGCSPSREPGLWSTSEPRRTLSGQVVQGAGGVTGREIQVDVRYKIDHAAWLEIEAGHAQFGTGLPLFVLFDDETARFPWLRLYASTDNEMTFQSSVMGQRLYSRQFKFLEAF